MNAVKRKSAIEELFEPKRANTIQHELAELIEEKKQFLLHQRRASLLVDQRSTNQPSIMGKFGQLYRRVHDENISNPDLISTIVKESVIVEWPRQIPGLNGESDSVEIDFAPLIHRARNVVKCRTSHPTMRIKIHAFCKNNEAVTPKVVEAFFRASLVKMASEETSTGRQVAGKMILTQREGTPASRNLETSGASVSIDGKLVSSQKHPDASSCLLLDRMGEQGVRTTPLKYEHGVLCATFPEMGVTLNSMVDRRQLATRYAIQVEVVVNIDNETVITHVILSHPFLIAITNDQTEPLLNSIFWHRLVHLDHKEPTDTTVDTSVIEWKHLRQAIRAFVKAQHVQARFLTNLEVFHIQTMIILPRIMNCTYDEQARLIEVQLFGNSDELENGEDVKKRIRNRLLTEEIEPNFLVERREFMLDHCISILDMSTVLGHSVWQWMFKAAEMILDVGHRLSPAPSTGDKKSSKTKKHLAANEDYQTMLHMFNKGFLNLLSTTAIHCAYMNNQFDDVMGIRFCDENHGCLSFSFGLESGKCRIGSLSAEQVKDFKMGLTEVLMDESYPSRYSSLLRIDMNDNSFVAVPKREIFQMYVSQRQRMNSIPVNDQMTVRVDPLSGQTLARAAPKTFNILPSLLPSTSEDVMKHLSTFVENFRNIMRGNALTEMANQSIEPISVCDETMNMLTPESVENDSLDTALMTNGNKEEHIDNVDSTQDILSLLLRKLNDGDK